MIEPNMTMDEIIRFAILSNKDETKDKLTAAEWADLGRDLGPNLGMVLFAARILAGKPCEVEMADDDPGMAEFRALAHHLGATVKRVNNGPGLLGLVFSPPTRN
jgi:hypothetical protein